MSNSFSPKMSTQVQSLLNTISNFLGCNINLSSSPAFVATLDSVDGKTVNFRVSSGDTGSGYAAKVLGVASESMVEPASGAATLDGTIGTAVMVASTVTVAVPAPADGELAVPTGSNVYATVTTPGGKVKQLSAVRSDNAHITISSPGSGYGALLESAGVAGTLVSGTIDINLTNAVGDRLAVVLVASHGTAGELSVKRKSGSQVTVDSWVDGTGIQALDLSDVKVYNFGQAAHETSTVRWAVVRP